MKKLTLSVAMVSALSIVAAPAVLAQDEEPAGAEASESIYALDVLDPATIGVVRNSALVAGEPISHWVRKANEWFLSMPFDEHYGPQGDCQASQGGPVFNLQNGPFGMTLHFECEIQPDQYILIQPGGGTSYDTLADGSPELPEDNADVLLAEALDNALWMTNPTVNLNGTEIPMGGSTWYQDEPWTYDLPEGNILEAEPGVHTIVTNGWFLMLEPLEPGTHTIVISDEWLGPAIAPWDVDADTGVVNEEFVPIGSGVTATAVFDITVPEADAEPDEEAEREADEAAADDEVAADEAAE